MNQSEQINELALALSKAQAEFGPIPKSRTVDFVNRDGKRTHYKYADLSDVIEVIKAPLSKYGLSHTQQIITSEGRVVLSTKLMHSSGQWLSSVYPVTLGSKPQESGSAITYARRYTLTSLLGIQAEEDNDGDTAPALNDNNGKHGDFNSSTQSSTIAPPPRPWKYGQQEWNTIEALCTKAGLTVEKALAWCSKKWPGIDTFHALNEHQFDMLVIKLKEEIDKASVK